VSDIHRHRMTRCYCDFTAWLAETGQTLNIRDPLLVDAQLATYIQICKDADGAHWKCKFAVLGVQWHHRHLRGFLPRSWDSVRSWHLSRPVGGRVPMPELVLHALCCRMISRAFSMPEWTFLLFLLQWMLRLGHEGMLRPIELYSLRWRSVYLPRASEQGRPLILAIASPKNRGHLGRVQFRLVRSSASIARGRWFKAGSQPDSYVWPASARLFRTLFDMAVRGLKITDLRLTPGSLRPGGATTRFHAGDPVANIKFEGGWRSERSLGSYIQEGLAAFVWRALSDEVAQELERLVAQCTVLFAAPPPVPWLLVVPPQRMLMRRGWRSPWVPPRRSWQRRSRATSAAASSLTQFGLTRTS